MASPFVSHIRLLARVARGVKKKQLGQRAHSRTRVKREGLLLADSVENSRVSQAAAGWVGKSASSARFYVKSQPERLCGHSGFQSPTRTFLP